MQQLRQQFAQPGQDTLGEALGVQELEQILTDEIGCYRQRIYPPMVTLRLFIDQILSSGLNVLKVVPWESDPDFSRFLSISLDFSFRLPRLPQSNRGWRQLDMALKAVKNASN
jgi:hypothetical protein